MTTIAQAAFAHYREFPVPGGLADYFLCFWEQVITGSGEYVHRVLPDACVDIVFVNDAPPVVVGPWTDPLLVRFPAGTRVVGARLHPGRAPGILGIPAAELLNQSVSFSDARSASSARFRAAFELPGIVSRSAVSHSIVSQSVVSQSTLAAALAPAARLARPADAAILASIGWLVRHPDGSVAQLSRSVGISPRQLQRRFSAAVGYGPKMFQSVLRFQRLLNCARKATGPAPLADLAAMAGYADQAHMTREVQRFAGGTPRVVIPAAECTLKMSDLFKTDQPIPE